MRIKDQELLDLLDENQLEFNYNEQITGRMLLSVSLYIDNEKHLVDVAFSKDGLEIEIILGEDNYIELTDNQINLVYDMFENFFKAQERQDIDNHHEYRARQDDYLSYYIR